MYNKHGFASFEFYFVMVVISLLVVVGIHRYLQLAEEVQRFSFEALAKNFSTAIYNAHEQWFIRHQDPVYENIVDLSGEKIHMSEQGWPLSVVDDNAAADASPVQTASIRSCVQLWMHLLQNPKPISYVGGDAFGTRAYHLSLTETGECRYQLLVKNTIQVFFDYSPTTGQVVIHSQVERKK